MIEGERKALEVIANKAARAEMGQLAWPTVALASFVLTFYVGSIVAALSGILPLWAAAIINATATYASYTVMHEAVHGNIAGKKAGLQWLNTLSGVMMGIILMIPFSAHRVQHFAHHQNTNDQDNDPDSVFAVKNPLILLITGYRSISSHFIWFVKLGWEREGLKGRMLFVTEIAITIVSRVVPILLGYWQEVLVFSFLCWVVGTYINMVLFAWIVHHPHKVIGRYVDTSTFTFPKAIDGLISWLWLFQNYHSIHHLFPRIPFYAYKRVFTEIRPVMEKMGSPIHDIGRRKEKVDRDFLAEV